METVGPHNWLCRGLPLGEIAFSDFKISGSTLNGVHPLVSWITCSCYGRANEEVSPFETISHTAVLAKS